MNSLLVSLELKDLKYIDEDATYGSNLIEPTDQMIEDIVALLLQRKDYLTIKRAVRHPVTNKGLSKGQIKEIHAGLDAVRAELKAKELK